MEKFILSHFISYTSKLSHCPFNSSQPVARSINFIQSYAQTGQELLNVCETDRERAESRGFIYFSVLSTTEYLNLKITMQRRAHDIACSTKSEVYKNSSFANVKQVLKQREVQIKQNRKRMEPNIRTDNYHLEEQP